MPATEKDSSSPTVSAAATAPVIDPLPVASSTNQGMATIVMADPTAEIPAAASTASNGTTCGMRRDGRSLRQQPCGSAAALTTHARGLATTGCGTHGVVSAQPPKTR
ncbi:hypothetical protein GCM10027521_22500 [Amycolatopsis cihanbeyliensis]